MKKNSINHLDHTLNFIDVFSGAGGLSCGMEMAGLRCLLGVDLDRYAMQSFAHNHRHAKVFCSPIEQLDTKTLRSLVGDRPIHAVVGGPPCQGFSTAGRGDPKDQRNQLFLHFVRLVRITKPYFVVIENVTGLLAKKNEKTLQAIVQQFAKLGYNLNMQVLSAHHFGVPERRRRTIIIGSRINQHIPFPLESHGLAHTPPSVTVGEALSHLQNANGEILNHDLESAQVRSAIDLQRLKHIPEGKGIRYAKDERLYLPKKLRHKVNWKELPEGRFRQTRYQRLDRNEVGPTIMTHRHSYFHPTEHRYLTPREAAKIQSFPNDFLFYGPISAQWRQIGNAVPPLLGKAIGQQILSLYAQATEQRETGDERKKKKRKIKKDIHTIRGQAFNYKKNNPTEQNLLN